MVVTVEERKAFIEEFVLVIADTRHTATHALALRTCTTQRDSRDTIVNQFVKHLFARPILITKRKEETIAYLLLICILIIDDMKAVLK